MTMNMNWRNSMVIDQFKKIPHMFDVAPNNFGALIGDLVVLYCTYSIPKRSHEKAVPYSKQELFHIHKLRWGLFFTPKCNEGCKDVSTNCAYCKL